MDCDGLFTLLISMLIRNYCYENLTYVMIIVCTCMLTALYYFDSEQCENTLTDKLGEFAIVICNL